MFEEEHLRDECYYTLEAPTGWSAWNPWAPEIEFCRFAAALVGLNHPGVVLETGVGRGYLTEHILPVIQSYGGDYFGYEQDEEFRKYAADKFAGVVDMATPSDAMLALADLTILDSDFEIRYNELQRWVDLAKAGSYMLFHDATIVPGTPHHDRANLLLSAFGPHGVFFANPRGGYLVRKP